MDQKTEFSKWILAIEGALREDAPIIDALPDNGGCECGDYNCTDCFPDDQHGIGMAGTVPVVCPTCGHSHEEHDSHQDHGNIDITMIPQDGLTDMAFGEDGAATFGIDGDTAAPVAVPRSGSGKLLGQIVQKFVKNGDESPLTYGDELEEADYDTTDDFDMSEPDYGAESPVATRSGYEDMEGMDPDEAMGMIANIMKIQSMGISKSNHLYSKEELSGPNINPSKLKRAYAEVTGTVSEADDLMQDAGEQSQMGTGLGAPTHSGGGQQHFAPGTAPTMPESINTKGKRVMENVDKDVAAMIKSLKRYDKLNESVLGMTIVGMANKMVGEGWDEDQATKEKLKSPPEEVNIEEEDDKQLNDISDHQKVQESAPCADPEILAWMARFSSLGNMKGYGR